MTIYNSETFTLQPETFEDIYNKYINAFNTAYGTSYDINSFSATDDGRFLHIVAQFMATNEIECVNIANRFKEWLSANNTLLQTPTGTADYIIEQFANNGYTVNLKPIKSIDEAGKNYLVLDVGKDGLITEGDKSQFISTYGRLLIYGMVTIGSQSGSYKHSNNQVQSINFEVAEYRAIKFRSKVRYSNTANQVVLSSVNIQKILYDNYIAEYRVGAMITPQKYLEHKDIDFAKEIKTEYSIDNGSTWQSDILFDDYKIKRSLEPSDVNVTLEVVE